jgi:predicted ester cyclase
MGNTSPTGKRVEWPFAVVFDMANERAKAHRGYGDQVSLMTQLGLMPDPAKA